MKEKFLSIIILGHIDDDRTFETSIQLRQAHGVFPSAFGSAIFYLVDMLEDEEIIENGAIGILKFDPISFIFSLSLFSVQSCSKNSMDLFIR